MVRSCWTNEVAKIVKKCVALITTRNKTKKKAEKVKSILEDRYLEDGGREDRLLWELRRQIHEEMKPRRRHNDEIRDYTGHLA
jgi:hypothetical protein